MGCEFMISSDGDKRLDISSRRVRFVSFWPLCCFIGLEKVSVIVFYFLLSFGLFHRLDSSGLKR